MYILETETIPWEPVTANTRTGRISRKFIREGELAKGVGYTCDLVWYHGDEVFTAPRHRHDFDQIRLTLGGTTDYGHKQVAGTGDAAFFPAGAFYGPERFEEAEIFLLQWSPDWVTRQQSDAAFAAMAKTGTFRDGHYITTDEDGQEVTKDGANAVWEWVTGKPRVIPQPKFATPILMHPAGYAWRPGPDGPDSNGMDTKDLGHFTEGDLNITTHRWRAGSTLELGPERTFVVWVSAGSITLEGRELGSRTMIFSDHGEAHELVGQEPGEATVLRLPLPE